MTTVQQNFLVNLTMLASHQHDETMRTMSYPLKALAVVKTEWVQNRVRDMIDKGLSREEKKALRLIEQGVPLDAGMLLLLCQLD